MEYDISDHLKIILSDRFIIKMIRSGKLKKEMFELREDKYYLKRVYQDYNIWIPIVYE